MINIFLRKNKNVSYKENIIKFIKMPFIRQEEINIIIEKNIIIQKKIRIKMY